MDRELIARGRVGVPNRASAVATGGKHAVFEPERMGQQQGIEQVKRSLTQRLLVLKLGEQPDGVLARLNA